MAQRLSPPFMRDCLLMSWLVEYDTDITDYLDAGWIVLNLNRAIFRLRLTDHGLPSEGELTDHGAGLYWWIVTGHSLLIRRTETATRILEIFVGELRDKEEIEEKLKQHRTK